MASRQQMHAEAHEGFHPLDVKNMSPRQFATMRRNIENTFHAASPQEHASGMEWYSKAHDVASGVGHGDIHRGAGVIAALSPQTHWDLNVPQAHEITRMKSSDVEALKSGDRSVLSGMALNHQPTDRVLRAVRIHTGEDDPEKALGRVKISHFYHNMVDPSDPSHVTIDAHAHDLAIGQKLQHKVDRGLGALGRYATFADAYTQAAHHLGVIPNQVQSTTWEHWRSSNLANVRGRHGSL